MKIANTKLFILFLLSALLFIQSCNKGKNDTAEVQPIAIRVVKPQITTLQEKISYVGTIHARREVKIISRIQGTLLSLPATEGTEVKKGEVIARIYAPELEATVQRLQAEVDYWNRRYEADLRLEAEKAIPPEQVAISKRAYLSAKASLAGAQSNLDKTIEKSPFGGVVLKWLVDPGQPVMPGQPILILGDNQTEIQVEVVEEELKRGLKTGTPVVLYKKDGASVETQVREIAPQASGTSRTFTIKIPVPQSLRNEWRKGESVKLGFVLKSAPDAIAVPVEAIADRDNRPRIFLIRDGKAHLQYVQPGIQQGNLVQVDFSYNGQDMVATTNLGILKDGIPVFTVQTGEVVR
ncbi:MAG: efflux RND transporter periplasmic adaptor subunit [Calditrichia bacterium]